MMLGPSRFCRKQGNDTTEGGRPDLPPMHRDPIERDPMNPAQKSLAVTEPKPAQRPDLDWSEHED
jgi:hypothetical protein